MRILVLGARGQLGTALLGLRGPHEVIAAGRQECDVTDREATLRYVRQVAPEVVINAAAYTSVDGAESAPDEAMAVNFQGSAHAAAAALEADAALVYGSTSYVFRGDNAEPYGEDDEPQPLNLYGLSKLYGEYAATLVPDHYIVRTEGLYGFRTPRSDTRHFIETILQVAREKGTLQVVADHYTTPTFAPDLAAALQQLVELRPEPGCYHLVQSGSCTWYEFAAKVFELTATQVDLQPTTAKEYGSPAPRPAYAVLDCSKARRAGIGPLRPWEEALADYLAQRETSGLNLK